MLTISAGPLTKASAKLSKQIYVIIENNTAEVLAKITNNKFFSNNTNGSNLSQLF
jgi:hypothetical protein